MASRMPDGRPDRLVAIVDTYHGKEKTETSKTTKK